MKSVILICLLSLSVCFSVAASTDATSPTQAAPPSPPTVPNETDAKPKTPEKPEASTVTPNETKSNKTELAGAVTNSTTSSTVVPQSKDSKNETTPAEKDNKTEIKPSKDAPKVDDKTTEAPKTSNETAPVKPEPKINNGTNPDSKDSKTTVTTPKSEVVVSTAAPKIIQASRAFDGPSFIGGIILTLGLLAIGFMGFKYYKNQTERNYHTL